jgi:hypothetical protein
MKEQENTEQIITEESADLFIQQENERRARELDISVEYYILEFT